MGFKNQHKCMFTFFEITCIIPCLAHTCVCIASEFTKISSESRRNQAKHNKCISKRYFVTFMFLHIYLNYFGRNLSIHTFGALELECFAHEIHCRSHKYTCIEHSIHTQYTRPLVQPKFVI